MKPPLGLHAEVVYPDGTTVRWDSGSPAKDRPTGISFRTARFDGFTDGAITLRRRIDLDYPDLALLDGINLIGQDGAIAYEGRVGTTPRSLSSSGHSVTIQAQGWMGSARDQPMVEVYVDRDLSKWVDMGRQRRLNVLAANYSKLASPSALTDTTGQPVVEISVSDDWVAPYLPLAEAWWLPQPGITIGKLYYSATSNLGAPWTLNASIVADDTGTSPTTTGSLIAGVSGYLTGTGKAALLELTFPTTPSGAAGQFGYAHFAQLAVYGNHTVPLRGADPGGVAASDVIIDVIRRFCPKLNVNPAKITPTTYAIPHLSLLSDTDPYDVFLEVNKYHRFGLEVYENREPWYRPLDLTDYDWEVRTDDPGTTVSLQGDDATNLFNGIIVRYTDLNTGRAARLSPKDFPQLVDSSPDNRANATGTTKWAKLSISAPTTQAGALQIGAAYLAEYNQIQSPGTITITGHIRDRAGHWQQGWKVRAGDRVAVTNLANDRPRLVVNTDWQHDAKTLSIGVDSSFKRLDAVLARFDVALAASNLTLPA